MIFGDEIIAASKLGNVKSKMIARGMVETEHFKRSSGAAVLLKTMDMKASWCSILGENTAEGLGITMKISDDRPRRSEEPCEFVWGQLMIGGANGIIAECKDIDEAEL